MTRISSNTIVKNGMPFIGKVLRQVAPLVDELIITISEKSEDETIKEVSRVFEDFPGKVFVDFENVTLPAELTQVEQAQVDRSKGDWILFLSDDDYWPTEELRGCLNELDKDKNILAYDVSPYQLMNEFQHDTRWRGHKWFSKFLRREGLRYIKDWPEELPADKDGNPLYWRTHKQVKHFPYYFYHLALLKDYSFRTEPWMKPHNSNKAYRDQVAGDLPQRVFL